MEYSLISRLEKSLRWKSDFYKEAWNMNSNKKSIEITGQLLFPITVGASAFIHEADGMRRTSTVLSLERISQTEMRFETRNTNYHLHLISQEVAI